MTSDAVYPASPARPTRRARDLPRHLPITDSASTMRPSSPDLLATDRGCLRHHVSRQSPRRAAAGRPPPGHVGKRSQRDRLATASEANDRVATLPDRRTRHHQDVIAATAHDPVLRHPGRRVDTGVRQTILDERGVGHLDDEVGSARVAPEVVAPRPGTTNTSGWGTARRPAMNGLCCVTRARDPSAATSASKTHRTSLACQGV